MTPSERRTKLLNTGLKIGAHYGPGGKHLLSSLQQALDAPATAMQLFGGNPRHYWCSASTDPMHMRNFADVVRTMGMYVSMHACYITNFAADPELESRSHQMTIHCISNQMLWANRVGANAVVFHSGSAKDNDKQEGIGIAINTVREGLIEYRDKASQDGLDPTAVRLLLENCAGDKDNRKLGGEDLSELLTVCNALEDALVGICIDTTHAYAAGHTVDEIIEQVNGPLKSYVDLIHFNQPDPEVKCGKFLDRHSVSFSEGAFTRNQLCDLFLAFRHLPLILEGTPNLADDLVWMLQWELELRRTGKVEHQVDPDDIFSLAQA